MRNFIIYIVLAAIFLTGCGNSYSPERYFQNFISSPVPASVEDLDAKYSGFPQGYLVVTFKINEADFHSLQALKALNEVDLLTVKKDIEESIGGSIINTDIVDSYNKFYFRFDKATEKSRDHVSLLMWHATTHDAYFFFY